MKKFIVLLGPPGSGKGTQATNLVKEFGLTHISTGECLREEVANQTDIGKKVDEVIAGGNYVLDDIVNEIVERYEKTHDNPNGYLFDGYPRTVSQAEFLDRSLASQGFEVTAAIDLDVDDEVLVQRILMRGRNSGRRDDNEAVARKRIKIYHERTSVLEEYYQKQGKLRAIKGDFKVEETWEKIKEIMTNL